MKALVWHGATDIRCDSVPDPTIENERDAIIEVTSCAICGSDLHFYDRFMPGMKSGDVTGHENMGEFIDVGPAARKSLKIGDRVAIIPLRMRTSAATFAHRILLCADPILERPSADCALLILLRSHLRAAAA
jgi:threonine dehydrogenase-like Zn-dependent dehydrogenase